ncbi:uncharacterized protein LOC141651543 [Silene latifolia]|uniref:uncharacterized protein LOC141651543 n=1 Tax=Silene latifolia TaxID=37657 RepID=UPI003D77382A
MSFNYVEKYRASIAKIHSLENELGKLKAEHLACDVERRRLAIELEVKNDEVEYLTKKLGFSKDAEAMLIARYDQTFEYNREVEAEVGKLMAEQLDWDFERRKMERNLEVKNDELEDLTKKLGFRKDTEAKVIKRYEQALEYNREVEAKVEAEDAEIPEIQIFLRSHDGNTISMRVEPFMTIDCLKSKIYLEKGCPPHQQRLVFGKQQPQQLEGSHTLADYDIQEKSTIHLVWLF